MAGHHLVMSKYRRLALGLPALVLVLVSSIAPIIVMAFNAIEVADITAVWSRPGVRQALIYSTWQATVSMLATIALGLFPTWILTRYEFRGRRFFTALMTVPFVLPTVVVGASFLALLPPSMHRTTWAVVIAHVFFNISVVIRTVGPLWRSIDDHLLEAARTLGASPWQVWQRIILPMSRSAIISSGALIFLLCFTSFGVITVLGGPGLATVDIEVYRRAVQLGDLSGATVLALSQTVIIVVAITLWSRTRTVEQQIHRTQTASPLPRRPRLILAALTLFFLAPIAALIISSLRTSRGWTLSGWQIIFGRQKMRGLSIDLWQSVQISLLYAIVAAAIAVPVGIAATQWMTSKRSTTTSRSLPLVMIPLATSPIVIGLGILITYDTSPFDFRSSWLLIPVVHASIALPFIVRSALPLAESIPHELRAAAAVLGASPWRRFLHVDLPLLRPALATATAFSLAMSLGEFGATSFLTRRQSPTLPISISTLFSRAGDLPHTAGMAAAVLLLAVTSSLVLLIDRGLRT